MPAPSHPSRRVSASLALSLLFGCQAAPLVPGPDPLVAGPPRSEALPRPVVPAEPEPPRVVGTWRDFGRSVAGRPLRVFELPGAGPATLLVPSVIERAAVRRALRIPAEKALSFWAVRLKRGL